MSEKDLGVFANYGNWQSVLKRRKMCQFVEKYKKIQISQICKLSKFAKWSQTLANVSICREIQKNSSLTNLKIL